MNVFAAVSTWRTNIRSHLQTTLPLVRVGCVQQEASTAMCTETICLYCPCPVAVNPQINLHHIKPSTIQSCAEPTQTARLHAFAPQACRCTAPWEARSPCRTAPLTCKDVKLLLTGAVSDKLPRGLHRSTTQMTSCSTSAAHACGGLLTDASACIQANAWQFHCKLC